MNLEIVFAWRIVFLCAGIVRSARDRPRVSAGHFGESQKDGKFICRLGRYAVWDNTQLCFGDPRDGRLSNILRDARFISRRRAVAPSGIRPSSEYFNRSAALHLPGTPAFSTFHEFLLLEL